MTRASTAVDMTGKRFGRLVVTGRAARSGSNRQAYWTVRCDCGSVKDVNGTSLRLGRTISCGCFASEAVAIRDLKHGAAVRGHATAEYMVWRGMVSRCHVPSNRAYKHYGGRGIVVCERWRDDFSAFIADVGPRPDAKHWIERKDNDKGYEPSNCIWAPIIDQARNRRSNRAVIRDDGVTFGTLVEAGESVGVHATGIRAACMGQQPTAGGHSWKFATLRAKAATP